MLFFPNPCSTRDSSIPAFSKNSAAPVMDETRAAQDGTSAVQEELLNSRRHFASMNTTHFIKFRSHHTLWWLLKPPHSTNLSTCTDWHQEEVQWVSLRSFIQSDLYKWDLRFVPLWKWWWWHWMAALCHRGWGSLGRHGLSSTQLQHLPAGADDTLPQWEWTLGTDALPPPAKPSLCLLCKHFMKDLPASPHQDDGSVSTV